MSHVDQSYIVGIREGNDRVLKAVYSEFEPRIIAFVVQNSGSEIDGQEIFQRSIIALYEKLYNDSDFTLTCQFYTLIYSIARNLWFKEIRRKKPNYSITDTEDMVSRATDTEEMDFSKQDAEAQRHLAFWHAFEMLGEKCQKLLKAYFEDKSGEEIASLVEMTYASYRVKKNRCTNELKSLVQSNPVFKELTTN